MRILVLTPYFQPHVGGSQRYIEELYSTLRIQHPEIEVDVICYNTDHAPSSETYRGLHVYRVPCREILPGQFALPNYWELWQVLKRLKRQHGPYDIVNSHTRFFDNSWWAPLVAWYLGAKSVLTDHCATTPEHTSPLVNMITKTVDTVIAPLIARSYQQVTVVSRATAAFLKNKGIKNSILVPGAVDLDHFKTQQHTSLRNIPHIKHTFSPSEIVVTFAARLIPSKGAELALEVALELVAKYPQVHFVFAGVGPLSEKIAITNHPQIHFAGKLSGQEMPKLLGQSDIFIHPSSHHEGLPLVLVEAAASQAAIITTTSGGVAELIEDQKTGLIITATKKSLLIALIQLLQKPVLRQKLATAAHDKVAQSFTWQQSADIFNRNVITV